MNMPKGPGWPDQRGWVILGFFGIAYGLLGIIRENPLLLGNASFMQFAGSLTTGGVLTIAANFFGGTKAGGEVMSALAAANNNKPPPGKYDAFTDAEIRALGLAQTPPITFTATMDRAAMIAALVALDARVAA